MADDVAHWLFLTFVALMLGFYLVIFVIAVKAVV